MNNTFQSLKLSLLHIGFTQLDAHWQYDNVISPFSRLYLITNGDGWVYHNNQKYVLKPGFLYLIPSFSYSRYHCDSFMEQYYISMLDETEEGLSIYEINDLSYQKKATGLDYHLFTRLLKLNPNKAIAEYDPKSYDNRPDLLSFNQPSSRQMLSVQIESHGILLQLFSRFLNGPLSVFNTKNRYSFHRINSSLRYINQNLEKKLTVRQLAYENHLSPDHYSRLFKKILGISPIDYINNKRLERAQLMLTTSNTTLHQIAELVGIPNIHYFSRLFKRRFGVPPGEYRANQWKV